MELNHLPIVPRLCFNWLPTYRYGFFAYKSLQQACALQLQEGSRGLEWGSTSESHGSIRPSPCVRPVALDSMLELPEHRGYLYRQFMDVLEPFSDGRKFFPLTEDIALIVVQEPLGGDLLNNVMPYMTPAPHSITALLAISGGYAGIGEEAITEAHHRRRAAAERLREELALAYDCPPHTILFHLNAVGGLIEGTLRYLHRTRPHFRTCVLSPEYWDFMRLVLTYSPEGLRLVPGREQEDFPRNPWIATLSKEDTDLAYLSFTSNPVGTVIPEDVFLESLEAVPDDTLFFIDCTSVDTEERSSTAMISRVLKRFSHKNLLITKSFSKEYDLAHLRVGYGLFTRTETAEAIWPFMSGYPAALSSLTASSAIRTGTRNVLDQYRLANQLVSEMAEKNPKLRFTGNCSNYTLVFFEDSRLCAEMKERLRERYGNAIYPGELPMQGGGNVGLGEGEINLASMQNIPFLAPEALRLVVTPASVRAFERVL